MYIQVKMYLCTEFLPETLGKVRLLFLELLVSKIWNSMPASDIDLPDVFAIKDRRQWLGREFRCSLSESMDKRFPKAVIYVTSQGERMLRDMGFQYIFHKTFQFVPFGMSKERF